VRGGNSGGNGATTTTATTMEQIGHNENQTPA